MLNAWMLSSIMMGELFVVILSQWRCVNDLAQEGGGGVEDSPQEPGPKRVRGKGGVQHPVDAPPVCYTWLSHTVAMHLLVCLPLVLPLIFATCHSRRCYSRATMGSACGTRAIRRSPCSVPASYPTVLRCFETLSDKMTRQRPAGG